MRTQVAYSEEYYIHDNPSHPENSNRLRAMITEIKNAPFYNDLQFIKPEKVTEELLKSVHSEEMIQQVKQTSDEGGGWLDMDTYVCPESYEISRLATGGLLQITKNVNENKADNGFALIRPPGHHATRNRSMGFCLFNNVAVVADIIAKKGKKILIFDHDVHHGNGTQDIFYNRKDVLYQSFHLHPHYPGTGDVPEIGFDQGEGYTVNAPLRHGTGNSAITTLLEEVFLPIADQFKPDITFFSVGYDAHHHELLGGLKINVNFFGEMIKKYQKIQPKIVCTLEGGYNLDWIGKCIVSQLGQLISQPVNINDPVEEHSDIKKVISELKSELGSYWKL